jgi:alkylhydroperoxidase family enzyme
MARIPYIEEGGHPELAAEIGRIKGGRGGVLNIYKLLLHSPALAMSWLEHSNTVRWKTSLPPRLRELVIIRMASNLDYAYALGQHVPKIALADGVSLDECEALKDWRASGRFDDRERSALALADAMLASPQVPAAVLDEARRHFNDRKLVELCVLVGTYIMHNRVFSALGVDVEKTA